MTSDFPQECREAFLGHVATRAAFDPNQPGCRNQNRKRRAQILAYIDDVLDAYNDWQRIAPLDLQDAS